MKKYRKKIKTIKNKKIKKNRISKSNKKYKRKKSYKKYKRKKSYKKNKKGGAGAAEEPFDPKSPENTQPREPTPLSQQEITREGRRQLRNQTPTFANVDELPPNLTQEGINERVQDAAAEMEGYKEEWEKKNDKKNRIIKNIEETGWARPNKRIKGLPGKEEEGLKGKDAEDWLKLVEDEAKAHNEILKNGSNQEDIEQSNKDLADATTHREWLNDIKNIHNNKEKNKAEADYLDANRNYQQALGRLRTLESTH